MSIEKNLSKGSQVLTNGFTRCEVMDPDFQLHGFPVHALQHEVAIGIDPDAVGLLCEFENFSELQEHLPQLVVDDFWRLHLVSRLFKILLKPDFLAFELRLVVIDLLEVHLDLL